MRTIKFNKLIIANHNGYMYPVIICDLEGFDKMIGYLSIFREKGYQLSATIVGEWDLASYYFPEDPVKDHLESKLKFFEYLDTKAREAIEYHKLKINIEINKEIAYDFARAAWVCYTNNNRCGKRVSEEDFHWVVTSLETRIIA